MREASFVLLFGFLGTSPAQATAVFFAWFLSVATGSFPGFIEYLRYRKGAQGSAGIIRSPGLIEMMV